MKKIVLLTIFSIIFSACTVVKTNYSEVINQKNKNILFYYLPETLLKINAKITVDTYYLEDKLIGAATTGRQYTFTSETIADTRNLLVLEYCNNGLFSDDLLFNVNEKGLLSNFKIETDDKTSTIIETLSKAIQDFKPLTVSTTKNDTSKINIEPKEYNLEYIIKASEINKKDINIPFKVNVIDKNDPSHNIQIDESYSIKTPDEVSVPYDYNKLESESSSEKLVDGIITRPIKNLKIIITTSNKTEIPNYIQIADVSKILVLPITRTAFAKTTNEMTISNGIINSNKITRPSPINGFVQIPINIAKAVVSIPAQLIQIRINNNTNEKNLLKSEKEKLEYELNTKNELMKINKKLDSLSRIK